MKKIYGIFFFKQKTAYEIYQCDWSSDVCSSDLDYQNGPDSIILRWHSRQVDALAYASFAGGEVFSEIGRASCRERV